MSDEHWRDCDSDIHVYIYSCNNWVFVQEEISLWTFNAPQKTGHGAG